MSSMSLHAETDVIEFLLQRWILLERTQHDRRGHVALMLAHTAHGHAVMLSLDHHCDIVSLSIFFQRFGDLRGHLFLYLWTLADVMHQAIELAEPDHLVLRHHTDPALAYDVLEVMRTGRTHTDGSRGIEALISHVGEAGDLGLWTIATAESLADEHLGHATCRVLGVVIVVSVDHQRVQNALELACELVDQSIDVAWFYEFTDVVVAVESLVAS